MLGKVLGLLFVLFGVVVMVTSFEVFAVFGAIIVIIAIIAGSMLAIAGMLIACVRGLF